MFQTKIPPPKNALPTFALLSFILCSIATNAQVGMHDPAEYLSHTLPVLYINTEDYQPITSKTDYIDAQYWLDAEGFEGYESIGSAEEPLPLQIKGRGNSTWNVDKKPYRIKLDKKAALLGMNKNKHWCLMAEIMGVYIADYLAFEYSRRVGIPWAPEMRPVEFVLNGDYVGLYFITEKIRIDKDRINITEQDNFETDPEKITGGWLMEIDNTSDTQQMVFRDRSDDSNLRFTWHSPDSLSTNQYDYVHNLLSIIDSLIYVPDKSSTEWEKYIDIDALARFYIVNELMDNCESFSGSCFFYKDRGNNTKIIFGPCWDAGSCFSHYAIGMRQFIYNQTPSYSHMHWIGEIAKYPHFQAVVRRMWREQVAQACNTDSTNAFVDSICSMVAEASLKDVYRWNSPLGVWDVAKKGRTYKTYAKYKYDFLNEMWGKAPIPGDVDGNGVVDVTDVSLAISFALGNCVFPFDYDAADIDHNNVIDVLDVSNIIALILRSDNH